MAATADYSATYDPESDFDRHVTRLVTRRIAHWLRPGDELLEIGAATGLMTSMLVEHGVEVTAVERSPRYLALARRRALAHATFVHADAEDFEPGRRFNHVTATALLNELPDPAGFLRRCRGWLAPGGMLHVSLPNPRSIHRMVAREMGLIDDLHKLSDRGAWLATRQILDGEALAALGREAGLTCAHREPVLLKPLTNAQLAGLPDEVIDGLDAVARHFPEHGAVNYAVFVAAGEPGTVA